MSWRSLTLTDHQASFPMGQAEPLPEVEELRQSANSAWDTLVAALPRGGIALAVLATFILMGRLLRPVVRRRLARSRTPSFSRVFARLTSATMTVVGFLVAVAIVFPSVRPVDLLAGAGVLSVAAGFAFQDILQNLLAGILLLFRQPFRGGDQIELGDVAGTVEEINIRETVIVTYDGQRVLIPNAKVYSDVITVQTARPSTRSHFFVGIAYESDIDVARKVALKAVRAVDGVRSDPPPEVLSVELATSTIDLEVLFWCDPTSWRCVGSEAGPCRRSRKPSMLTASRCRRRSWPFKPPRASPPPYTEDGSRRVVASSRTGSLASE